MSARINRLRNFTAAMLMAHGFTAFLAMGVVGSTWKANAPKSADPAHGVVYIMAGYADRFYDAFQTTATALSLWAFGIGIVVPFLIVPRPPGLGFRRFTTLRGYDPHHVARWGGAAGIVLALIGVFVAGAPLVHWLNAMGVVLRA